jgi:uncharacterized protein (TIGR00251 family)
MTTAGAISRHRDGVVVAVYVQPRASRTAIAGVHDGALRLRVAAPPVAGAANHAVVELLSKQLGVRKADVEILSGASGRSKRVLVRGVDVAAARRALGID